MLYTHNWGLFLAAGLVCALVPCWYVSEVRSSFWKDALIGFGFAGLLYLPWLPTLLHQVQHTGAPWLNPPNFGAPVQITKSLLGGGTPDGGAAAGGRHRDRGRDRAPRRGPRAHGRAGRRGDGARHARGRVARVAGLARVDDPLPRRAARADAADRRARAGARRRARHGRARDHPRHLGDPALLRPREQVERRRPAQVGRPAAAARATSSISMQPEQGPLLAYHLEDLGGAPKLRFASPLGAVENDRVMDWTDGYDKLKDATPAANLEPLLANLPPGGRVLFVYPVTGRADDWDAPWTELVRRRGRSGARRSRPTRPSRRWRRCPRTTAAPPASAYAACSTRRRRGTG